MTEQSGVKVVVNGSGFTHDTEKRDSLEVMSARFVTYNLHVDRSYVPFRHVISTIPLQLTNGDGGVTMMFVCAGEDGVESETRSQEEHFAK